MWNKRGDKLISLDFIFVKYEACCDHINLKITFPQAEYELRLEEFINYMLLPWIRIEKKQAIFQGIKLVMHYTWGFALCLACL